MAEIYDPITNKSYALSHKGMEIMADAKIEEGRYTGHGLMEIISAAESEIDREDLQKQVELSNMMVFLSDKFKVEVRGVNEGKNGE